MHTLGVGVEWDFDKALSNVRKHGVDFADAATALHDDFALTIEEEGRGEARLVTLAMDALGRLLVVVHVPRGRNVRLISARKATKMEAREYAAFRKP